MKIVLWIIVIAILFLMFARYVERHNVYFPMKKITTTPEAVGLNYEDVYFKTSDNEQLHGWFIPNNKAGFTVIFCHGNAGNISHRLEKLLMLYTLGVNIFIFDYRGYGKSQGIPSESGLYKDAKAAYNYLRWRRKIPGDNIILYGESLGGAVVIELAHKEKVRALITEEAFSSLKDMARIAYPIIPQFMILSKFDSVSKIREIKCAKLIIHSSNDEIVPFSFGEKLFDAANPPKKFLELSGSHNTAFLDSEEQFRKGIKSFIDSL